MSVVYRELERRIKRSITFEPCLPRPAKEPPNGPGWLHEIKHDGFRIVAQKEADKVRLLTRNGYDFTERYPLIVDAIRSVPAKSCIVDGEVSWWTRMAYLADSFLDRTLTRAGRHRSGWARLFIYRALVTAMKRWSRTPELQRIFGLGVFALVRGQVSSGDERIEFRVGHANLTPHKFVVAVPRPTRR
jgi:hypothetical protein